MTLPKIVTFTGADDSVKAKDLKAISTKYPGVEWGILFGGGYGTSRWPSIKWLEEELPKLEGCNLTAHLCGKWVYDLVLRGDFTWIYPFEPITHLFKRIQLNFHGQQFPTPAPTFLQRIAYEPFQFIFQDDGVNTGLIGSTGGEKRVRLFDVSHGAGVLPTSGDGTLVNPWPKRTMYEYMGYAGGLGPLNVKAQLKLIEEAASPNLYGPYWIDCETRVRSRMNNHDIFDLKKVKTMCKEVWG